MTPENFCYWLQGYIEIADPQTIKEESLSVIKNHLDLVFHKVTESKTSKKKLSDFTGFSPNDEVIRYMNCGSC